MSKRVFASIVFAFLALIVGAGLLWTVFGTNRINLTEADIQGGLDRQLPMTVGEITIDRVAVRLADDRLAFSIQLQGKALGQPISAAASARGAPRYDRQAGEVFFRPDDIRFVSLAIGSKTIIGEGKPSEGASEESSSSLQRIVEGAAKIYLTTQPVYRFENNLTGIMIRAALAGVTVEQNNLVISLSIWHLTLLAALFGLAVLVVLYLAYLFIRQPPWRHTRPGT